MADVAQGYRDLAGTLQGFFDRTREDRRLAANLGMEKTKLQHELGRQAVEDAWNAKVRAAQSGELEQKIFEAEEANKPTMFPLSDLARNLESVDHLLLGDGGKNWQWNQDRINEFSGGKYAGATFANHNGSVVLTGKDGKPISMPKREAASLYQHLAQNTAFITDPIRLLTDKVSAMESGAIPMDTAKLAKWKGAVADRANTYLGYADKLYALRNEMKRLNPYIDTKDLDARIERFVSLGDKESGYLREDKQAAHEFDRKKDLIRFQLGIDKELAGYKAGMKGGEGKAIGFANMEEYHSNKMNWVTKYVKENNQLELGEKMTPALQLKMEQDFAKGSALYDSMFSRMFGQTGAQSGMGVSGAMGGIPPEEVLAIDKAKYDAMQPQEQRKIDETLLTLSIMGDKTADEKLKELNQNEFHGAPSVKPSPNFSKSDFENARTSAFVRTPEGYEAIQKAFRDEYPKKQDDRFRALR